MREDKGFEISKFTDEEIAPDENIGVVKGIKAGTVRPGTTSLKEIMRKYGPKQEPSLDDFFASGKAKPLSFKQMFRNIVYNPNIVAKNIDTMIKNNLPSTLVGYLSQIHMSLLCRSYCANINTPINVKDCKIEEPIIYNLDFKESISLLKSNYSDIGINNETIYETVPHDCRYKIVNFLGEYIVSIIKEIRHKLKMVKKDIPKVTKDESEIKLFNSYCALLESYWKIIKRYTDAQGKVNYEKVLWSKGKIGNKELCFFTAPLYFGDNRINAVNGLYTAAMSKDFAW